MRQFDYWVLRGLDRAMEFFWQWFGWRRRHVLLVLFVLWIASGYVDNLVMGKAPSWIGLAMLIPLGLFRRWDHRREERLSPEDYNGTKVLSREFIASVVIRVVFLALCVFFTVLAGVLLYLAHLSPIQIVSDVLSWVGMTVYVLSCDTLVPMGPRKKIKLPSLSLTLPKVQVPAPAYGGSWG